ncbi:hypothetical protein [Paenibacillus sp. FSL L8-0158]|uniref:hypothetical protein n=1 Tax=Paenibacillus sp. FSL L8-0158 TaxID=2954752 RepID=UPI003158D25F
MLTLEKAHKNDAQKLVEIQKASFEDESNQNTRHLYLEDLLPGHSPKDETSSFLRRPARIRSERWLDLKDRTIRKYLRFVELSRCEAWQKVWKNETVQTGNVVVT